MNSATGGSGSRRSRSRGSAARARSRVGLALSWTAFAILFADALVQLFAPALLRTEMYETGFPLALSHVPGDTLLIGLGLYVVPRTRYLGAVALTGFLGGAIAIHLRIGETGSPPQLVCLLLGTMIWSGLYLRDVRLRQLFSAAAA